MQEWQALVKSKCNELLPNWEVWLEGTERKAPGNEKCRGLVPASRVKAGIVFPQRKGHSPGYGREKKLKWII